MGKQLCPRASIPILTLLSRQPSLSWGEYHVLLVLLCSTSHSSFLVLDSMQASQCSNSCPSSSPSTPPPHVFGTAPHLISHFLICWFFSHLFIAIFFRVFPLEHLPTCLPVPFTDLHHATLTVSLWPVLFCPAYCVPSRDGKPPLLP